MARSRGEGEQRGQAESGKVATSFRIKPETRAGLDMLHKAWGMSQNAIIDRLVGDAVLAEHRVSLEDRVATLETELAEVKASNAQLIRGVEQYAYEEVMRSKREGLE